MRGSSCSYIAEHDIVYYLQNVTDINCEWGWSFLFMSYAEPRARWTTHIWTLWYEGWMLQRKATPPWWHSHSKVGHVGSNSCWQWATKWPDWKDSLSTSNASTTRKVYNRHRPLTSNDTQWHILIAYSYYICSNDDWSIYLKCWRSFLVAENTLSIFVLHYNARIHTQISRTSYTQIQTVHTWSTHTLHGYTVYPHMTLELGY